MIITRGGTDGQRASLTVCPGGHTGGIGSLGDLSKVCPGGHMGGIGSLGDLRKGCPGGHMGGIGSFGDVRKVCPGDNMLNRLIGSVSRVA